MIIRTQGKESIIFVKSLGNISVEEGKLGRFSVKAWVGNNDDSTGYLLGEYEIKERAIEVLDEIADLYGSYESCEGFDNHVGRLGQIVTTYPKVYIMPED